MERKYPTRKGNAKLTLFPTEANSEWIGMSGSRAVGDERDQDYAMVKCCILSLLAVVVAVEAVFCAYLTIGAIGEQRHVGETWLLTYAVVLAQVLILTVMYMVNFVVSSLRRIAAVDRIRAGQPGSVFPGIGELRQDEEGLAMYRLQRRYVTWAIRWGLCGGFIGIVLEMAMKGREGMEPLRVITMGLPVLLACVGGVWGWRSDRKPVFVVARPPTAETPARMLSYLAVNCRYRPDVSGSRDTKVDVTLIGVGPLFPEPVTLIEWTRQEGNGPISESDRRIWMFWGVGLRVASWLNVPIVSCPLFRLGPIRPEEQTDL